jgi:rRNA processing protein Gar1
MRAHDSPLSLEQAHLVGLHAAEGAIGETWYRLVALSATSFSVRTFREALDQAHLSRSDSHLTQRTTWHFAVHLVAAAAAALADVEDSLLAEVCSRLGALYDFLTNARQDAVVSELHSDPQTLLSVRYSDPTAKEITNGYARNGQVRPRLRKRDVLRIDKHQDSLLQRAYLSREQGTYHTVENGGDNGLTQLQTPVGKVDEILGPLNQVFFTIKPQEGIQAKSFKAGDKFYIGGDKLLPLDR